jgi:dTDP-4-dehydrorhamnose 3,5-epimerase-like enzyme
MTYKELSRVKHKRDDGWLSELVSMNYKDEPFNCIHSYLVVINPHKARAKHYHKKKDEWLAITSGNVTLFLRDVISQRAEILFLDTDSEDYKLIYVPTYVAHALKNIGESKASVVVFSTMPEDPNDTIPYQFEDNNGCSNK